MSMIVDDHHHGLKISSVLVVKCDFQIFGGMKEIIIKTVVQSIKESLFPIPYILFYQLFFFMRNKIVYVFYNRLCLSSTITNCQIL